MLVDASDVNALWRMYLEGQPNQCMLRLLQFSQVSWKFLHDGGLDNPFTIFDVLSMCSCQFPLFLAMFSIFVGITLYLWLFFAELLLSWFVYPAPGSPRVDKLEIEGRGFHTNLYAVCGIYSGGKEGKSKIQWLRSMIGSPDLISIPGMQPDTIFPVTSTGRNVRLLCLQLMTHTFLRYTDNAPAR